MDDRGVDDRIILKRILEQWDLGHGLDRYESRQVQVVGFCERGNEDSDSIKREAFIE